MGKKTLKGQDYHPEDLSRLLASAPVSPHHSQQTFLFAYQPMHDVWMELLKFNNPQDDIESSPGYLLEISLNVLAGRLGVDSPIYRADIDWDALYSAPPKGLIREDLDAAFNIVNELRFLLSLPTESTLNLIDIVLEQPDSQERVSRHIDEHIHHTPTNITVFNALDELKFLLGIPKESTLSPLDIISKLQGVQERISQHIDEHVYHTPAQIKEMNWMEEFTALATFKYGWYPIYCLSDAIYQSLKAFAVYERNLTLYQCQNCGRLFFRKKLNNVYCGYGTINDPTTTCHDAYRKDEKRLSRIVSNAKSQLGDAVYDLVYQSIKTNKADKMARQASSKARQSCTDFKNLVSQRDLPPLVKYALRATYIDSIRDYLHREGHVPEDYSAFQDIDKLLSSEALNNYLKHLTSEGTHILI